jgi:tetratricopeptide (TPR) repeat protein
LKPDFALSHHNLGDILVKKEDWEGAIGAYQKAIQLDPNFVWSYYNLAELFTQLNEWDNAIKDYKNAFRIQKNLPKLSEKLADALQNQAILYSQQAFSFYELAIAENPDQIQNYYKALEINPNNADLYFKLATVFVKNNNLDIALAFYQMAIQIEPNNAQSHFHLGNIFVEKRLFEQAIDSYKRAIELKPDLSIVSRKLAEVLKQKGQVNCADTNPSQSDKKDIQHTISNYEKIIGKKIKEGKLNEASAICHKALESFPDSGFIYYSLGRIEEKNNQKSKAIKFYYKAIEFDQSNYDFYHHLGDMLQSLEKLEDAELAYRNAIQLKPDYSWSYHNLGKALFKQGKLDEAIVMQEKAVEIKPNFYQAYDQLGQIFYQLKQYDYAIKHYRYASQLNPTNKGIKKQLDESLKKATQLPKVVYASARKKQLNVKVTFATILLNEEEYIEKNLKQHYQLCDEWIIVEGACRGYPTHRVTKEGLSSDRTASIIQNFPDPEQKIRLIQHGWTEAAGEDAKSEIRNRYAELAQEGILVVIDADEFYRQDDLHKIIEIVAQEEYNCCRLPQLHLWKGMDQIIVGGYWDTSHNRIYSWNQGLRYRSNHNHPETESGELWHESDNYKRNHRQLIEVDGGYIHPSPCCFHFGFAKSPENMRDKTDYYIGRGEDVTRPQTISCREAWFSGIIPDECKLLPWKGGLPDIFEEAH